MIGVLGAVEMLCALAAILTGIWYYLVGNYGFWKERGVPGPEPRLLFGNIKDIMLVRDSFGESLKKMCDQFPGAPLVGIYARRTPVLLVRDPELVKDVMIKDFSTFSERGNPMHEKIEPLAAHLFNLETKRWRSLRPKLSPLFTTGKMKHMFALILECADYFEKYIHILAEKGEPIDCREITAKFTTDVIGSCAFGLQMNAIGDEDSEFRKMGRKVFEVSLKARILQIMRMAAPWLYELIGISALPLDVQQFFMSSMKETIDYRMKNDFRRGDLVDMLIEIKNNPEKLDFETLRLRPPVVFHMRKAVTDYTFRGTNVTIPKGQRVWIPVWDIHQNPEYYPKPEVFDPERFTDDMRQARHPMTYLPFGDGPRNCIGARFAVYQTKLGLIKVLSNFKVDVCDKTYIPYKPDPKSFLLAPIGGVYLQFSKVN
ncbi:cytochrome P450 6j1-like isoform X2 [Neodiprion virginianus]|uniref:cytochrome P450 6j1-like isoform X2 n=1 Tax=Neodiprion virginianus TaxID=2961670 RepID=UPI001EE740AB|nr:cytochrome P450 6j1-like isoform X2 [Neodiprion virginianus]